MLLALLPLALVAAAIGPHELAVALLFIESVLANVSAAVFPTQEAFSVHFVHFKLSLVFDFGVLPGVDAFAIDVVHVQLADVGGAVLELEGASAVFLTEDEAAFVEGAVWVGFVTEAMGLVVEPLSFE